MNSLPKGFEYVGDGGDLFCKIRNMAIEHAEDILRCTRSSGWGKRLTPKKSLYSGVQYAFRIGSPIHHAWKQETQPMKYEEQRWPYKINPDGSVTRNGYTITAREAESICNLQLDFFKYKGLIGNRTIQVYRPLSYIKIGRQTIKRDELEAFIKEYQSGEWKEQDVMVRLGDRVQDHYGDLYIVACLGATVGLINLKTGKHWSAEHLPLCNSASTYSLKAVSGVSRNFKLINSLGDL